MSKRSTLIFKAMAPLAVLGAVAAIPACVSSGGGSGDGTGGAATGNGGATAAGGAVVNGGATAAGGAVVNGGATAVGGATSTSDVVGVPCNSISSETITAFAYDATSTDATKYGFGDYSTTLSGYVYVWGGDLTQNFESSNWHIKGTVADYAGFNLQFAGNNCDAEGNCEAGNCNLVDASAYTGIQFKIWGTTGGKINLTVTTASNDISDAWITACGETVATPTYATCTPTLAPAANAKYSQTTCANPSASITLDATATSAETAQLVSLKWTDFVGGKPSVSPDPAKITSIFGNFEWQYAWSTDGGGVPADHQYATEIYIDDIAFVK